MATQRWGYNRKGPLLILPHRTQHRKHSNKSNRDHGGVTNLHHGCESRGLLHTHTDTHTDTHSHTQTHTHTHRDTDTHTHTHTHIHTHRHTHTRSQYTHTDRHTHTYTHTLTHTHTHTHRHTHTLTHNTHTHRHTHIHTHTYTHKHTYTHTHTLTHTLTYTLAQWLQNFSSSLLHYSFVVLYSKIHCKFCAVNMTCNLLVRGHILFKLQLGHLRNAFVTNICTEAAGGAISDTHALLLRQTGQFFFSPLQQI